MGLVDFAIFPHLDHPDLSGNTTADAEEWAAKLTVPAYAIDDQTALRVVDGKVDVISAGNWRMFPRWHEGARGDDGSAVVCSRGDQPKATRSTTKIRVSPGAMTPPAPRSP